MRINRQTALRGTATARKTAGAGGGGPRFSLGSSDAGSSAQATQGSRPLAGVDALLSLQEVPDATTPHKRAVRHAEDILDVLEDVQMGMLTGSVSLGHLNRLKVMVAKQQEDVNDPKLKELLKEVELRAQVELAKLGQFPK